MDLVEEMRGFEIDHEPDGWPAVRMRQISALCAVAEAAQKLDAAMLSNKIVLLGTAGSADWDWAWDQLADALAALKAPNSELSGPRPLAAEGPRSNDGLGHGDK